MLNDNETGYTHTYTHVMIQVNLIDSFLFLFLLSLVYSSYLNWFTGTRFCCT